MKTLPQQPLQKNNSCLIVYFIQQLNPQGLNDERLRSDPKEHIAIVYQT